MAPNTNQTLANKPKSGLETPPTTSSEWEASSIGGLTTSASELESIASGSEVDVTSADEDDQYGDETIVEVEIDDAVLVSRAPGASSSSTTSQRGRQRPARPSVGRTLSDIDSGAEVDDEREEDDGLDDLRDSIADLDVGGGSRLSRQRPATAPPSRAQYTRTAESVSRSPSPSRIRRESVPQTSKRKNVSRGWRLPERTFVDWVLAS